MKHTDATRAKKLRGLLARLRQGKTVQNRDLKTWLGADGFAAYEQNWAAQKALREELSNKPDAIIDYESRLKKANFTYNKAEGYDRTGRYKAAELEYGDAEKQFERLLERLQEIIAADPSLCIWFDRDTTWSADSDLHLHPEHVPQVVTSKSPFNRAKSGGILQSKMDKRAVKIMAIEGELAAITQAKAKAKGKAPKLRSVEDLLKVVKDGD